MLVIGRAVTKDGTPVPDGVQAELRLHNGNVLYATDETENGYYRFIVNGNPGPHYVTVTWDDEVEIASSKVVGVAGAVDVGNLPLYFRQMSNGYLDGLLDELAVSASGTGMNVTVAAGGAFIEGILYDQFEPLSFSIAAADLSQPRIDLVVAEVVPHGAGEDVEGRSRIVVKTGTPAAVPVAPSLTQTTSLWQVALAEVRVDAGVSAIASNKVTDRRTVSSMLIPDRSITAGKLVAHTITDDEIGPGQVNNWHIADGTVGAAELGADAVTTVKIGNDQVTEAKLAPAVRTKLNDTTPDTNSVTPAMLHTSWRPRIQQGRNDADANFSAASNTLLTVNFSSEAGTYTFMAIGSVRATDTSSASSPRGWLRILRGGAEVGAEFFYLPGGYSGNGDGAVVFATGTFTYSGSTDDDFTLGLNIEQGTFSVNQRQLMVWLQRVA